MYQAAYISMSICSPQTGDTTDLSGYVIMLITSVTVD